MNHKLAIYDFDDTLFFANQRIGVMLDGKMVWMTPQEHHRLDIAGEIPHEVDYSFLKSSSDFVSCLKPNVIAIECLIKDIDDPACDVVIMTARQTMDDVELFMTAFEPHGIDPNKLDIIFAGDGNPSTVSSHELKRGYFKKFFNDGYSSISVYDDNMMTMAMLQVMKPDYHEIDIDLYGVASDGSISKL
jgi:hypothetical protein